MDIAIVLLNYKRHENIARQLVTYKDHYPIYLINNNVDIKLSSKENILVYNNSENLFCMTRWKIASNLDHDWVVVLDDDILLSVEEIENLVQNASKHPLSLTGIYGKILPATHSGYEDLFDVWSVSREVDIVCGAAVAVRPATLRLIKSYLDNINYPIRGDDIFVSLAITDKLGVKHYITDAKPELLPEGTVALSRHPDHKALRYKMLVDFKNTYL